MDPFCVKSAPITGNRREYRSPAATGARLYRNRKAQVRALSIIGPAGGKAPRQGKSPRKATVPFALDRF